MRKNPWAVAMAKRRAKVLGPERCSESARIAAAASAKVRTAKAAARRAALLAATEEPEWVQGEGERYNCGLVGCMRCGNIPTPEQQAEIDKRHAAKMQANAEAFARHADRLIFAEVYKQVMETVKPS